MYEVHALNREVVSIHSARVSHQPTESHHQISHEVLNITRISGTLIEIPTYTPSPPTHNEQPIHRGLHMFPLLIMRTFLYLLPAGVTSRFQNRGIHVSALRMFPAVFCDPATSFYYVAFVEEPVDFFECEVCGFGVAEVLGLLISFEFAL